MKKSKQIQLVLISSFLAVCATTRPDEIMAQSTPETNRRNQASQDTTQHHHSGHFNNGSYHHWGWHGAFHPFSNKYGQHQQVKPGVVRRPGTYPHAPGIRDAKSGINTPPKVARGGIGATQTQIAS